jgi:hypothetical protein
MTVKTVKSLWNSNQIQCYFTVNKLTTDFHHAYMEELSTSTALDWLREIDDQCGF